MKALTLYEITCVSGGHSNPDFDLAITAKEGALCGVTAGIFIGSIIGTSMGPSDRHV